MNNKQILAVVCIISLINTVSAQSVSEKRSYVKSMPAGKDTRLEVDNKYGDIRVTSWNKDSVYIIAEIEAFAPNHEKLAKMFNGININIAETASLITAKTEFDQGLTVLLESFKGLTEKIIDYNSKVKINYFINAPDNIDINFKNQFGDINMENNKGTISATLSNGAFKANSLNNISELDLNFGNAEIGSVRSARLKPTFSEFVITECGELSINSTSSKFNIKRAEKIDGESRRDKFFIGIISNLGGISYFTDYRIENLEKGIELTLKYGSLDISRTDSHFDKIDLTSVYSDITLSFEPASAYSFEIRHTNSFVVVPEMNTRSEKKVLNEDKKEFMTSGTTGNTPGSGRVRIDATRGNIYLR